jgi:aminomethyltransferase
MRGLVTEGRQPPRAGSTVSAGGRFVGEVTSGNFSPTLEIGIALAFIDNGSGLKVGDPVVIETRGRALPARLHMVPFVTKEKG